MCVLFTRKPPLLYLTCIALCWTLYIIAGSATLTALFNLGEPFNTKLHTLHKCIYMHVFLIS